MLSTLFYIPTHIGPSAVPLFGWGLLLAVWAVVAAATVGWTFWKNGRSGFEIVVRSLVLPLLLVGAMICVLMPMLAAANGQGIPVRGYGFMLLVAAMSGTWLTVVRGRTMGFDADTLVSLAMEVFLWGIVGARLFYVIQKHDSFFGFDKSLVESFRDIMNIAGGGLVVFGSLPTAAAATWWFAKRRGLSVLRLADCIAPGLLVGLAIGRVGCFLNGCCYGGECDLPWAVCFPPDSPPFVDQSQRGLLEIASRQSLPIHPTQLYSAIDAGILAMLAIAFTPLRRRDGEIFALVLSLHPLSRIVLEEIRTDEQPVFGTPFSISQLFSIVLLACAMGLWCWIFRQPTIAARVLPSGDLNFRGSARSGSDGP